MTHYRKSRGVSSRQKREFSDWLNARQSTLIRVARAICFDSQNADDVLQEALWARKAQETQVNRDSAESLLGSIENSDEVVELVVSGCRWFASITEPCKLLL